MDDDAPLTRLWCERALLPGGVASGVLITIEDDRIVDVRVDVDLDLESRADADVMRFAGLTLPGFANAHSHAFHRALRGRTHGGPGDFWTWREQMYAVAARLTPDNFLALATATFAEMVLAGYTVVGEFHYVHHRPDGEPYDAPNAMGDALVAAARAAGIRLTLLDTCYLRGGAGIELTEEQRRFGDGTVERWAERVDALVRHIGEHDSVRIGAAIHSVRAVDAASIESIATYATDRSMPLHAHVSEQIAENDQVSAEHGCTPTQLLARRGALSSRFTAVHATHLTDDDIGHHAAAGSTCCFCPTTERDLADGIGPSAALSTAGVALAIGSDQHAMIDPFEEVRAIETNERLRSMRRGNHAPAALLAAGTTNGYACLGWPDGGVIAAGALADLTSVGLDSPRLAGADDRSLLDAVVFSATASDVHSVVVGGRLVVRDGRHLRIDVARALAESIATVTGDGACPPPSSITSGCSSPTTRRPASGRWVSSATHHSCSRVESSLPSGRPVHTQRTTGSTQAADA